MSYKEFWEYSIAEIVLILECYGKKLEDENKTKQHEIYLLANLTSYFIGCSLSGNTPMSYEDIFEPEKSKSSSVLVLKETLLSFADEHNKRRN